jgi:hypothetical protein
MIVNKIIRSIITIVVIASVLAFAGCIGKETSTTEKTTGTPTVTTIPTSTPNQVVSTPTPTPKTTFNVTLKPGYKWYQDNNFSYRIGYPENWMIQEVYQRISSPDARKGLESSIWLMPESLDDGTPNMGAIVLMVNVYSDPKQAKIWEDPNFENYKQQGAVSKYGEITINGRKGYEVIMSPLPVAKNRIVVFTVGDLYYMVNVAAQKELFNKYESTFNDSINSLIIEK